jgi:hypothetical protein
VAAEKLATRHSEGLGLPEESVFFLGLAKKSRSLASLGMTKRHFFRSLFSLSGFDFARGKGRQTALRFVRVKSLTYEWWRQSQ